MSIFDKSGYLCTGMEKLDRVIFYSLDKAIKTYRQYAQRKFSEAGFDITIDQWLVLHALNENPQLSQLEIAEKVFKDAASITRIIDLLIRKELLSRDTHESDRRRFVLKLTREGKALIRNLSKVVEQNRSRALKGIGPEELAGLDSGLRKIIQNCND